MIWLIEVDAYRLRRVPRVLDCLAPMLNFTETLCRFRN
jgi:hypothetical protein